MAYIKDLFKWSLLYAGVTTVLFWIFSFVAWQVDADVYWITLRCGAAFGFVLAVAGLIIRGSEAA